MTFVKNNLLPFICYYIVTNKYFHYHENVFFVIRDDV